MNRNVAEAAGGTRGIAAAISGLAAGTPETNERVAEAQRAAGGLARMSGELQQAVARFTVWPGWSSGGGRPTRQRAGAPAAAQPPLHILDPARADFRPRT